MTLLYSKFSFEEPFKVKQKKSRLENIQDRPKKEDEYILKRREQLDWSVEVVNAYTLQL